MGFTSLQHIRDRRSTCRGACHSTRYVPPAGFAYPLGGLLPPSPCRPSFMPAALMGFTLRSFLLSEGIRRVSARMNPRAVFPVGIPGAEAPGPAQRAAASGLSPFRESLAASAGLVRPPLDAPLGFALSGCAGWGFAQAFARAPPSRFRRPALRPEPAAPRSLNRPQPSPSVTGEPVLGRATLTGFSHRINPITFKRSPVRAIGFTLRRVVHYCRPPTLLER
jgi:hypothetical protein